MAQNRPLSPHLSIWKWRIFAITSITHRITGNGLAFAGLLMFVWWLAAAAISDAAYAQFSAFAGSFLGWVIWIGLSWAAAQHLMSGIRHLLMDSGWGYSRAMSSISAAWVWVGALLLVAGFWLLFHFMGPGIF